MKRSLAVALVATLAFLGTACGDDDDTSSPTTGDDTTGSESTTSTPEDEGAGDGEQAAGDGDFCATFQELLEGEPTPDQLHDLAEIAPDAAVEPIETIAGLMEEDPENYFGTPEFSAAFSELGTAGADECADETIDVTTVEYEFQGIPEQVTAGTLGVHLTNEGNEVHEMIVLRKNDDTTESFEELLALPEEEAQSKVTEAGFAFANPGEASGAIYDVSEPGEYAAVCFIPVGTTSPDTEGDGAPHFSQGMVSTFTVG